MGTPGRLEVGRITRAHGIRGEVIVEATTNRLERFEPGAVLFAGDQPLIVGRASPHGGAGALHRSVVSRWIVAFEGVATRNEAEALRGAKLVAEPLEPTIDADDLWVHELIGAEVVDVARRRLGRVVAVEANPASDLLVLEGGGLIPLVFVVEADSGRVVVDPPPGLLDL